MQRILQVAALLVAAAAVVLLALFYVVRVPTAPPTIAASSAAPPTAVGGAELHLHLSHALGTLGAGNGAAPRARASPRGSPAPLALGTTVLLAFAGAFWLGSVLRRRRASAPRLELAQSSAQSPEAASAATFAAAAVDRLATEDALTRLAAELEHRDLEVQRLQKEIADWQDAWRLAKPRLSEQQETIEDLEAELAAARSAVAGMRRYVGELQKQRGAQSDSHFAEDVDAWIARFMHPAPRG